MKTMIARKSHGWGGVPACLIAILTIVPLAAAAAACNADGSVGQDDGLVAHWPLDGNASDASGNGNHGMTRGVTPTADRFGKANGAYHFDGTSSFICIPNSPSLDITGNITMSAWVKLASADSVVSVIDKCGSSWRFQIYAARGEAEIGATQTFIYFDCAFPVEKWCHVAATCDGRMARLYLDGALIGQSERSFGFNRSSANVYIGSDPFVDCEYYNGDMDDLRIYNRALSADEVQALCCGTAPAPKPAATKKTCTVKFDMNCETCCRDCGSPVGELPAVSRDGYVFKGWFTAPNGGSRVSASTKVTGDVTYYAHWTSRADELAAALGVANVEIATDSGAPWLPDGRSVRSGRVAHDGSSTMSVRVHGAGLLSFRWRVSSEPQHGVLTYSIDGIQGGRISGEQGWSCASILVSGDGWHTVRFTYAKDGGKAFGSDCGWIDSLGWTRRAAAR